MCVCCNHFVRTDSRGESLTVIYRGNESWCPGGGRKYARRKSDRGACNSGGGRSSVLKGIFLRLIVVGVSYTSMILVNDTTSIVHSIIG